MALAGPLHLHQGHDARWWRFEGESARCVLCPHACLLSPGENGRCGVRIHLEGRGLVSTNYGKLASLAVDPIEKKPLYHWKPGTSTLSLGSVGCNMRCPFCQNWTLAECSPSVSLHETAPDAPAELAAMHRASSVAFTYNEPLTWLEFILDTCLHLEEREIPAVLVSNGMINGAPLKELLPYLSAANIDLKAFTSDAYRFMGGELEGVKNTIKALSEAGTHLEVTFLLVPGINDDIEAFERMTCWLSSLDPVPVLHISRYFPNREWTAGATPIDRLFEFVGLASERVPWVYTGNVDDEAVTKCSSCGKTLIRRRRYAIVENNLDEEGRCSFCSSRTPIIV